MGNRLNHRGIIGGGEPLADTRQQIFEKVFRKMVESGIEKGGLEISSGFQKAPDVIVISDDGSFIFEPQNRRVTQWLHELCGLDMENTETCDKIRVHPCKRNKIIAGLRVAGFEVAC